MTRHLFLAALMLALAVVLALTYTDGRPGDDAFHQPSASADSAVVASPIILGPPLASSEAADRSEMQPHSLDPPDTGGIIVSAFDASSKRPLRADCIAFASDGSVTTVATPHTYSSEAAASISMIRVSAAGYLPASIQGDQLRGAADEGRIDVHLEGDHLATVHFYQDAEGEDPAEGVVLRRVTNYTGRSAVSDLGADISRLPILRTSDARGTVPMHISGPVLADFEYPQGRTLRILIPPGRDTHVYLGDYVKTDIRFVDASEGRPLQGVVVALRQTGRAGSSTIVGGSTNANGRVQLSLHAGAALLDTMPPIDIFSVAQAGSSRAVSPILSGRYAVPGLISGAEIVFSCGTENWMWRLVDSRTGRPIDTEARVGVERPLAGDSYFGMREKAPTPIRDGLLFVSPSVVENWQAQPAGARFVILVPGYSPWILRGGDAVPTDGATLALDPGEVRSLHLRWRNGAPVVDHVDVYRVEHSDSLSLLPGSGLSPEGWTGRFIWTGGRIVVVLRSAEITMEVQEQELRASQEIKIQLNHDPSVVRVEGVPPLIEDVVILSAHDGVYADLQGSAIPLFPVGGSGIYQAQNVPPGKYYLGRRNYVWWQRALGARSELSQYFEVAEGEQATLQWQGLELLGKTQPIRVSAPPDVRAQLIFQPVFEARSRTSYTLSPPPLQRTERGDILLQAGAPIPSAVLASLAITGFRSSDRFVVPVGVYEVADEIRIQGDPLRIRCNDSPQLSGEVVVLLVNCASAVVGPFERSFFDADFSIECMPGSELLIPLIGGPDVTVRAFVEGGRRPLSSTSPVFIDGAWQVSVSP